MCYGKIKNQQQCFVGKSINQRQWRRQKRTWSSEPHTYVRGLLIKMTQDPVNGDTMETLKKEVRTLLLTTIKKSGRERRQVHLRETLGYNTGLIEVTNRFLLK